MTIVCFVFIRKRNKAPDITKFLEVLYFRSELGLPPLIFFPDQETIEIDKN